MNVSELKLNGRCKRSCPPGAHGAYWLSYAAGGSLWFSTRTALSDYRHLALGVRVRSIVVNVSVCLIISASLSWKPRARVLPNFRWNSTSPWLGLSLAASRYAVYFRFCGWRLYSQAQAAGKERVFKVANHRAARIRYGHRFAVYSVTWPGCSTGGKVCSLLYCFVIGRSCLRQFNDIEDRICIYVRGDLVLWYDMIRYKMLF